VVDLNECAEPQMNDCAEEADCVNLFGTFTCQCKPGYGDKDAADPDKAGRSCETCSKDFCSGRGVCTIDPEHQRESCE
jgi:hypothetical protein